MQAKPKGSRFSNWEKILGWSWVLFTTVLARTGMDNVTVACEMQRLRNGIGHFKNVHAFPLFSMLHKRKSLSIRLPGQILHDQYKTMICFMPYTCICRLANHHLATRLHCIPWSWLGFESHLQCTKLEHSMVLWKCTTWKGQYTAIQNFWQLAGDFQPWLPASRMVHVCSLKPVWQSRRRLSSCCGRWETMLS